MWKVPNDPAVTMDSFKTVLRFLTDQKATIGYGFMAILTIGGERIFSMVSFNCPCNLGQNFAYGITFLLGPAVVLFTVGLFVSSRLWRLYTGCCLNPTKLCPRGNCLHCCAMLLKILGGACVAPIMWLCVALLNGTFYECAVSGLDDNLVVPLLCKNKTRLCREELARVPCGRSKLPTNENMELLLMFRAQSQVRGVDKVRDLSRALGILGHFLQMIGQGPPTHLRITVVSLHFSVFEFREVLADSQSIHCC